MCATPGNPYLQPKFRFRGSKRLLRATPIYNLDFDFGAQKGYSGQPLFTA